jgi:hypothetical protein
MVEEIQENKQWINKKFSRWFFITSAIATMGKHILMGIVGMPRPLAFLLAKLLCFFLAYDYLPAPKLSYEKYIISLAAVLIVGVLAFYVAAPYLETLLPSVLAYGISLISYGALLYFVCKSFKSNTSALKNS